MEQVPQLACWNGGLQALKEDRQGRQCGGAALYEKGRFDCTALTVSNDVGGETLVSKECCSVCYQQALRRNLWVGIFLLEIANFQNLL